MRVKAGFVPIKKLPSPKSPKGKNLQSFPFFSCNILLIHAQSLSTALMKRAS